MTMPERLSAWYSRLRSTIRPLVPEPLGGVSLLAAATSGAAPKMCEPSHATDSKVYARTIIFPWANLACGQVPQ